MVPLPTGRRPGKRSSFSLANVGCGVLVCLALCGGLGKLLEGFSRSVRPPAPSTRRKVTVEDLQTPEAAVAAFGKPDTDRQESAPDPPREDVTARKLTWNRQRVQLMFFPKDGQWRLGGCWDTQAQEFITPREALGRLSPTP
jgi:hypothetical protein